jgi:hypothetical protein
VVTGVAGVISGSYVMGKKSRLALIRANAHDRARAK